MNVKKVLISQPEPADLDKSPYKALIQKHNLDLTFYKFFSVEGIPVSEFRKTRIHLSEHTAVIFNSKQSVDNFFRLAKELRESIPETMKYFCSTEGVANYLQTYIQYRKRKIFPAKLHFAELIDIMAKHREEKFIFPCSDEKQTEYTKMLDKAKFKYTKAPMYTSVPRDLTHFNLKEFDIIALFSPIGVRALVSNFPNVKDEALTIAAFGASTHAALKEEGIKLTIAAPTVSSPSMAMAIENYIMGKQQEAVVVNKPTSLKKNSTGLVAHGRGTAATVIATGSSSARKVKPVIANKAKYKQRMEEKKAEAAARRAERAAEKAAKASKEA